MKTIRFSKLKAISSEISGMLGTDINPNSLVYITTEKPVVAARKPCCDFDAKILKIASAIKK